MAKPDMPEKLKQAEAKALRDAKAAMKVWIFAGNDQHPPGTEVRVIGKYKNRRFVVPVEGGDMFTTHVKTLATQHVDEDDEDDDDADDDT